MIVRSVAPHACDRRGEPLVALPFPRVTHFAIVTVDAQSLRPVELARPDCTDAVGSDNGLD